MEKKPADFGELDERRAEGSGGEVSLLVGGGLLWFAVVPVTLLCVFLFPRSGFAFLALVLFGLAVVSPLALWAYLIGSDPTRNLEA